jgi:GxxExxY protein
LWTGENDSRFLLSLHDIVGMNVNGSDKPDALVTEQIIGAAIEVHRALGPGLLEATYEECLAYELAERRLAVERQPARPVVYKGTQLSIGYRPDFVVEKNVIVELKTVERFLPVHTAQVLTYLKLEGLRVGLLLNFNSRWMASGIKRVVL